jgi:hypothetical protein
MDFLTRVTLTTLATCALLGATTGQRPAWLRLDLSDLEKLCTNIFQERQRTGDLAEQESSLRGRIQHKLDVALALARGRMPLPQAAGHFRAWSNDQPEFWQAVECFSPSGTEGEKLCRYVIDWMRSHLEDRQPELVRAATRRLYAELDERLRSGSPLVEP